MLRKIRITLAVLMLTAITLLFVAPSPTASAWLGWTTRLQLVPALLAGSMGVVAVLALVTLLVGRVYCSVICPLGVMQDVVSWASARRKGHHMRFAYRHGHRWLRYGVLALFVLLLLSGLGALATLLAPYSTFGRIAQSIFSPLAHAVVGLLGHQQEAATATALPGTAPWGAGLAALAVATIALIVTGTLAWRSGRTYCNALCPVGTTLGLLSRFALLRPVIDASRCTGCQRCARHCKASCIDVRNLHIDLSRCVACMDCTDVCRHDAIGLRLRTRQPSSATSPAAQDRAAQDNKPQANAANGRTVNAARRTLVGLPVLLTLPHLAWAQASDTAEHFDATGHGQRGTQAQEPVTRATPVLPPGALSAQHLANHCVGCQLCVASCPSHVLRPSFKVGTFMQPHLSYAQGSCAPECNRCSEVCPTGAIYPISLAEKSATRIGHAEWVRSACLASTTGIPCHECARQCPSGAILMAPQYPSDPSSPRTPHIDVTRCTGCGACEHACPASPCKGIYVEGHAVHSQYHTT